MRPIIKIKNTNRIQPTSKIKNVNGNICGLFAHGLIHYCVVDMVYLRGLCEKAAYLLPPSYSKQWCKHSLVKSPKEEGPNPSTKNTD